MAGSIPPEFSLIYKHFLPLAGPGALALGDDAAVFAPPPGRELVVAADAMVAGVHFLPDDPPDLVARKLLRTNLSDLAAMGATPLGYLLTVSVPRNTPEAWFAGFAAGLAADQAEFGLQVLGGDTTSTPGPVSLSLTILGTVSAGMALRRNGARTGDGVWITGTIGDGALGLLAATGRLDDPDGFLAGRYRLPQPRVALGQRLAGIATAAMDISDGLVQDLGHLARAGGLGAVMAADDVPLSDAARAAVAGDPALMGRIFSGGDDYELLFAADPADAGQIRDAGVAAGVTVTRIGCFMPGEGVRLLDAAGGAVALPQGGWSHF